VLALLPVELVLNVGWGAGFAMVFALLIAAIGSALLLLLFKFLVRRKELYEPPAKDKAPPLWIRGLLVLICTGVSFAHGSNDGQKGMGLIMLILVGILPLTFAVDLGTSQASIADLASTTETISFQMDRHSPGVAMGGYQMQPMSCPPIRKPAVK